MNFPWALCLAREDAASLAGLRLIPGIEVAEEGPDVWLRGPPGDEPFGARLSALPARKRYERLALDQLRQIDQRIPSLRLPALRWQPLNAWLQVEWPAAALPGSEPARIRLHLARSTDERDSELLSTGLDEFRRFAEQAALVRLEPLQFAAAADRCVLVRGTPLPPLPGRRFVLHGGVAVPAGFAWQPAVSAEVLARRFGVTGDALVLWNEDGTITRLHSEQFVPATRSALRATEQTLVPSR
jgi:hypothetical protein